MIYSLDLLNPPNPHRAYYDADGNIIIPSAQPEPAETVEPRPRRGAAEYTSQQQPFPAADVEEEITEWIIVEDEPAQLHAVEAPAMPSAETPRPEPIRIHVHERIVQLRTVTRGAVREGARQYRVSVTAGMPVLQQARDDIAAFFRTAWNFLAQPVWVPTRKREIKQYSRGMLFLLDIVRFGGTFTMIFLFLFVALNYDSFWQITRSKVTMVLSSPTIESLESEEDTAMIETLKQGAKQSPDSRERGELLSFLPGVGPPDNRILIPKLRLNIPLVTPPVDSLIRQDWDQVETDIQTALTDGVVHYPGTARPGQAGNFFVTGHSSYYPWAPGKYKTVFARLQDLKAGDEYWVYFRGDRHRYVVTGKREVSPSDTTVLDQPENKRIATLMTCTPVGTTLRRLVVVAQEVDPITREPLKVGERGDKELSPKIKLEALPI
ncbi:sortase [Candidatus Peribacteria bacterium]|nr:sortase [Candidatus Peribacteria bacterium]